MSNDLRAISPEQVAILQNPHVIAVNQDPMGVMGRRVLQQGNFEIWSKPIQPTINGTHSFAVVFLNRNDLGIPTYLSKPLMDILATYQLANYYYVYDLFDDGKLIGKLGLSDSLSLRVNLSGVRMVRLEPQFTAEFEPKRELPPDTGADEPHSENGVGDGF
jgi:hypothetical protein